MNEHRGVRAGLVVRRVWVTAAFGLVTTLVCWAGLMLAVPDAGRVPTVELSSGVVR